MKKSVNKDVTYGKGAKCRNCGLCDWRLIKEIKIGKGRFMHFYCTHCTCERLKYCDFGDIRKFLKDQYGLKGGKKWKKKQQKNR